MLIYYSTAGDTVIIVFLNAVVYQKRLFSIRNTCKAILLKSSSKLFVCYVIERASEGGFLLFVYDKKIRQPFCCYMASCLVRKQFKS